VSLFLAFLRRDALANLSYRLKFALDLLSVVLYVASFHFIAKMFGRTEALASFGGDYFPFVLIGIAFSGYQSVALSSFSQSIRQEQYLGTLESVLAAPVSVPLFLAASAQWDFLYATLEAAIYLASGIMVFGARFPAADLASAFAVLVVSIAALLSLGVLSAAFIIRFKRGDPVAWLLTTISELLGGVFFPVEVLPEPLRSLSAWVPMSHSVQGLRLALLNGAGLKEVLPHVGALAAFSAVFLPLGVWAFRRALDAARRDGELGHY
jgi:ABC-2 type transport system permease protein